MTKLELVRTVSRKSGTTREKAGLAIDALLEAITEELSASGKFTLSGFGTFTASTRKARVAVNPRTGEKMSYPARKVVHFKAGKTLKDRVQ